MSYKTPEAPVHPVMVDILHEMALDYDFLLMAARMGDTTAKSASVKGYAEAVWAKFPHPDFQFEVDVSKEGPDREWVRQHPDCLTRNEDGQLLCPAEGMLQVGCPEGTPLEQAPPCMQQAFMGIGRMGAAYMQEHPAQDPNFYLVQVWREAQLAREGQYWETELGHHGPDR